MNWADFGAAIALVMILEGLLPLISPFSMKKMLQTYLDQSLGTTRFFGGVLVVFGLILLSLVRG